MPTREPSRTIVDDIVKETKWARHEIEKLWSLRSGAGGSFDFNKLNNADASGAASGYLLAVVTSYVAPPTAPGGIDYAFQFIDSTPDRSLGIGPGPRRGFLFQVDPSSSIINDGNAGVDFNINANGGFNVANAGEGGVTIANSGGGGLTLYDSGLLGGLNLTTDPTQTGGLNIKNRGISGLGLVDNYASTGGGGVEIHSAHNTINIQTIAAGDITIDAAGNIILSSLPGVDPGISGALFVVGGVMQVSP